MMVKNRSVRTFDHHHHSSATVYAVCIMMELIFHHPSSIRAAYTDGDHHDSLSPLRVARSDWLSRITWSVREPLERANSYHVVHVT